MIAISLSYSHLKFLPVRACCQITPFFHLQGLYSCGLYVDKKKEKRRVPLLIKNAIYPFWKSFTN